MAATISRVRQAYEAFLEKLFGQLNAERQERFKEEKAFLGPLPKRRLDPSLPLCFITGCKVET